MADWLGSLWVFFFVGLFSVPILAIWLGVSWQERRHKKRLLSKRNRKTESDLSFLSGLRDERLRSTKKAP